MCVAASAWGASGTGAGLIVLDIVLGVVGCCTGRTAYRVVQEALTNVRKHAPGQPVSITLDGTPGTHLVIDVCNPVATGAAPEYPARAPAWSG